MLVCFHNKLINPSGGARSGGAPGAGYAPRGHHVGGAVQGVHAAVAQAAQQVQTDRARGRQGTYTITLYELRHGPDSK